jgi:secondary thiamine-phosphate synthase enzyme
MNELTLQSRSRNEFIDITSQVRQAVVDSGIVSGVVTCFVPHTTAAITINENADPDVPRDILDKLSRTFPQNDCYHHSEGNSDAHVKSTLVGCSVQIIVENGRLMLGTWQGIFFCEFDGPRSRTVLIKVARHA